MFMFRLRRLLAAAAIALAPVAAFAETKPFTPGATAAVTTTTSASTAASLGSAFTGADQVRIYNACSVTAFVKFGGSSATAATTDLPVPAGVVEVLTPPGTYASTILASGSSCTVYFTAGMGN